MSLRKILAFAVCACAATPAGAIQLRADEDTFVNVRFLLQAWGQVTENGAPDGESLGKDLFLRRARIILGGQIAPRLTFFFDTDAPNFGRDDFASQFIVQDARAAYEFAPALIVDVGLMSVPSLHNANQGAPTLFTVDYRAPNYRYPANSTLFFRDTGVQARGIFAADRLQYRVGVFRGVRGAAAAGADAANPEDALRLAGSLRFNFLEAEKEDFFYQGIYFGQKRVLSVGVAGEWQQDAIRQAAGLTDYGWYGADVFFDHPIAGDHEVIVQAAAMRWEAGANAPNTGDSFYAEAGWRYREVSPYVAWERFASDAPAGAGDFDAVRIGAAWWIEQHAASLKLEAARLEPAAPAEAAWQGTLQAQLFL